MHKLICGALAMALAATAFAVDTFKAPLDVPALILKRQVASTQMLAVARAGQRLVAVGLRGLILVSDDGGKQWVQSSVPVASDLTGVYFPTAKDGWVVGQDGVVLHTKDGGTTWEKQFDGRMAKKMLTDHFQSLVNDGNAEASRYLQDTQLNYQEGPEQVLLGVWFKDALHGFVCGSFGTLFATNDGGVTWESWVEKVDADIPYHYFAVRGTRMGVMIASEKGTVYRLDEQKQRFVAMSSGYTGTFFSLLEVGDAVLAMGLRGNAYRLKSVSAKWEKLETGVGNTISASTLLPDGGALLSTLMGQLVLTRDGGDHFQVVPVARPMSIAGIATTTSGAAVVVGSAGVSLIPLK